MFCISAHNDMPKKQNNEITMRFRGSVKKTIIAQFSLCEFVVFTQLTGNCIEIYSTSELLIFTAFKSHFAFIGRRETKRSKWARPCCCCCLLAGFLSSPRKYFLFFHKRKTSFAFFSSLAVVPTCKNKARSPTGADSGRNFSLAATLIHPNESAECASRQLCGTKSSETHFFACKFWLMSLKLKLTQLFHAITAKRFVRSRWTQKMKCRSAQRLSIAFYFPKFEWRKGHFLRVERG